MLLFPFVLMIQSFLNAALFLSRASDARSPPLPPLPRVEGFCCCCAEETKLLKFFR